MTALCPPGSDANASYRMVTSYWEMVASFLTSGVLNPELFYQSGRELLFCYARVRDILPALREKLGNPRELKNLEAAARASSPGGTSSRPAPTTRSASASARSAAVRNGPLRLITA